MISQIVSPGDSTVSDSRGKKDIPRGEGALLSRN